jgi:predicted RNase H-like HicB family nuclease
MHDSIFKNIEFELIINKQKNDRYKAASPSFPQCKGFGNTKQEAIEKLCNSISNYVKHSTQSFLKKHLMSNNYTEVITDPNNQNDFQHRIVNFNTNKNVLDHRVFLKSLNSMLQTVRNSGSNVRDLYDLEGYHDFDFNNNSHENDDLILGITLCLN